jgi:DNA-binding beta-propeller fold protein YncE
VTRYRWLGAIPPLLLLTYLVAKESRLPVVLNLPTSKTLTEPTPGHLGYINSFPATIALSPDGRYAAFLNDGYGTQETRARQSISVLDLRNNEIADFPDDRFKENAAQSLFQGIGFSTDGKHLYASVGSITDPNGENSGHIGNGIAVFSFNDGKIAPDGFFKIPLQPVASGKRIAEGLQTPPNGAAIPYPAGLVVIPGAVGDQLLVANNLSDNVVLLNNTGRLTKRFDLSIHQLIPSAYPYSVAVSRDGRRAWVSLWNASQVAELDLNSGQVTRFIPLLKPAETAAPGSHPGALLLSPDEKILYVALANADRVAEVSTADGKALIYLNTNLPGLPYSGTSAQALAQSQDGRRLFVADAALNAIAVFDVSEQYPFGKPQAALGFIPTELYPSALSFFRGDLLVATAKGKSSGPNSGTDLVPSERRHRDHPYIPTLMRGSIARISLSDIEANLPALTRQVEQDNLLRAPKQEFQFASGRNPIHHVIYVLKENRTFDQVLGDLGVGDGESSLTMYGADITPNEHMLARQFGVLDNFYDSGEVSGDGHDWSNAATTTDYNERTWQIGYRSRERTYDYQGMNSDEFPLQYDQPDIDEPATRYLWDNLAAHGVSYRYYGEFVAAQWCHSASAKSPKEGTPSSLRAACPTDQIKPGEPLPSDLGEPKGSPSPYPWPIPIMHGVIASKKALRDHYDPHYPDFEVSYPDQLRMDEFLNEFAGYVNPGSHGNSELPRFVMIYLPNDHTAGKRPGSPQPVASVADNDLALGRLVEAVSHSRYWDDTAIFVLEDDAQDGADHVDAHRSTAFVISKYSPGSTEHPYVEHRFLTTVSFLHSIETLLGLPPMNLNDAYAPLTSAMFSGSGSQPAYKADWRNRENGLIYKANPAKGPGAAESARLNFSHPDQADPAVLNAILWHDRKGEAPMPVPLRH